MMKRLHINVSGRVQGVGFRYFAASLASKYGLTGQVRNLYNGDVELEVEGSSPKITLFLEEIRQGNRFVRVREIKMNEIPLEGDKKFRVLY